MKKLSVSPRTVAIVLVTIVLSLTAAHVVGQYYKDFIGSDPFLLKIVKKLDLDGESNNLPNWYQSSSLLLSSFLLAIITLIRKADESVDVRYWGFLSLTFVYLSIDELVSIHEQATMPLRQAFDLQGALYLSWVIPAAALAAVFLSLYIKFLWRLPGHTRWLLIAAGGIYLCGALGVEMIGASFLELHEAQIMDPAATGTIVFQYSLITAAEELFEMSGIVIFIYTLLTVIFESTEPIKASIPVPSNTRTRFDVRDSHLVIERERRI